MPARFQTTRWSIIKRCRHQDQLVASKALGELCTVYWEPLHEFLRASGHREQDSMDLVQAFCTKLLERGGVSGADPNLGRFRHYLLGALRHFVGNNARSSAGTGRAVHGTTAGPDDAATLYEAITATNASACRIFERQWALTVLDQARQRLHREFSTANRQHVLATLEPFLHESPSTGLGEIAHTLGMSEGAIRVALHRLRRRLGELVREEISHTLDDPREIDDELRVLQSALAAID